MNLSKSILLLKELKEKNTKPKLWIRDDDFCTWTGNFYHLIKNLPPKFNILFSAVPYRFKLSLSEKQLMSTLRNNIYFCVHGYNHTNNAPNTAQISSEFPSDRTISVVKNELEIGYNTIKSNLKERFLPIFVPPWNFIHNSYLDLLAETGYEAVSADSNGKQQTNKKLILLNTQLDILNYQISYKTSNTIIYSLKNISNLDNEIAQIITNWSKVGKSVPIGFLTHHTAMDKNEISIFDKVVCKLEEYFDPFDVKSQIIQNSS